MSEEGGEKCLQGQFYVGRLSRKQGSKRVGDVAMTLNRKDSFHLLRLPPASHKS